MLNEDIVQKFNNIQVQFHLGVENDQERRNNIQKELTFKGFKNKFDYPFVWESWGK